MLLARMVHGVGIWQTVYCLSAISLWGVFGANTIILLAGLKNIPQHPYEAVELDGGGALAKFRNVTLPIISPTLFYTLTLGVIAAVKTLLGLMALQAVADMPEAALYLRYTATDQAAGWHVIEAESGNEIAGKPIYGRRDWMGDANRGRRRPRRRWKPAQRPLTSRSTRTPARHSP